MRAFVLLLLLGLACPNISFSQASNRISIQTGLFHTFFDKSSPFLNLENRDKSKIPYQKNFFFNSYELQYQRKIGELNAISVEGSYYFNTYAKVYGQDFKEAYYARGYYTINASFIRCLKINDRFNYRYGGGVNYRLGHEDVVFNYPSLEKSQNPNVFMESRKVRDFGINARSGLEYSPLDWLSLYSELDFIGFVYVHDKKQIKLIKDDYGFNGYPVRFDLSWRFGVGFNF